MCQPLCLFCNCGHVEVTCKLCKECLLYITTHVGATFALLIFSSINFTYTEGFAECRSLNVMTTI